MDLSQAYVNSDSTSLTSYYLVIISLVFSFFHGNNDAYVEGLL